MFNFDESKYISDFKLFTKAPDEAVAEDDVQAEKNDTVVDEVDRYKN